MDINEPDLRGSTSLHWAVYSKSELALNYLLAWGAETEVFDSKEMTPLHLAVKQVEAMKTNRMVRALLLTGANREVVDSEG